MTVYDTRPIEFGYTIANLSAYWITSYPHYLLLLALYITITEQYLYQGASLKIRFFKLS